MYTCVRACVRARARVCVCVCVCVEPQQLWDVHVDKLAAWTQVHVLLLVDGMLKFEDTL